MKKQSTAPIKCMEQRRADGVTGRPARRKVGEVSEEAMVSEPGLEERAF